ncbi:MAG TPA: 30S ribosomal protein S20 [Candidatus Babeliales bacterium]|nr:30S ribosomal protein S20 [Candidatus Babeliales bacterium]
MANLKHAKKAAKRAEVRRKVNLARKTSIKTAVKKILTALERAEDIKTVKLLLKEAEVKIARAKGKGLLHANTAARKISRLSKKVAAAQASK